MSKELAEKLRASKSQQDSQQNPPNPPAGPTADQEISFLKAQVQALQGQLQQRNQENDEIRLLEQAEKLQKERAQLEEEANLQKVLQDTFKTKAPKDYEDTGQIDPKELIEVMAEAVGRSLDAQSKILRSEMKQIAGSQTNEVKNTQAALMELIGTLSLQETRSQFQDFDEHAPAVKQILMMHPSLDPKRAYLLAKAEASSKGPARSQIESERPTNILPNLQPGSSRENEVIDNEPSQGLSQRQVFRSAALSAIDKVLANRQR